MRQEKLLWKIVDFLKTSFMVVGMWSEIISVPCDYGWSKNKMWVARRGTYARRLSKEASMRKSALARSIKETIHRKEIHVVNGPLWFSIHAELPNHKGDAINFVDLVADSIEEGTGLNDRWYSIRGVTWEVKPSFGLMHVSFGQDSDENVQVCGACGEVLPFHNFGNGKNKFSLATTCRECVKARRKKKEGR